MSVSRQPVCRLRYLNRRRSVSTCAGFQILGSSGSIPENDL
eukprot:CAMPEP_0114563110 /NCGR_PEP_ID=MMETSP0114-20121206/12914_1 /TAXON_ID=31324 /ORGANISM="Goniomonas sp, Strain m" /LENGTH=40 /DNA_ID= /DNA_START= /DNA_END= /DNA_ORIENTATION=